MSHTRPSQARIQLLLVGSIIAGMLVSSWLAYRLETRPDKPVLPPEKPLLVESP